MIGELFSKAMMGLVVLRHDQKPAGFLVNAVHNAGTLDPANTAQAACAVNYHACRLVDDDQMLILEDNIKRDILRDGQSLFRHGNIYAKQLAWFDRARWAVYRGACTVKRDLTILDKRLQARPGHVGQRKCKQFIQTDARLVGINRYFKYVAHGDIL